jgi:hypothetical protein
LNWGTVGGGKREWGGNGEGEVSLQATWDQGGQGSHHRERRDSKQVRGTQVHGELSSGAIKGLHQGELSRGCAMCLILSTCTYVSCYRVDVANKRVVFRL